MIWISIFIAIYIAWSVGVHTLGSTIGMVFGGGLLNFRNSLIISGFFGIIGVAFFSKGIVKTIGTDLLTLDASGQFAILLSMGALVTILAWKGLPISTGYVTIGSIAGYSLFGTAPLNIRLFEEVLVAFLTSPIIALAVSFLIYSGIRKLWLSKITAIDKIESFEKRFFIPSLLAFILMSAALGANSVGVVVGIIGGVFTHPILVLIGSIGFLIGVGTWSYKIARTMGLEITDLSPSRSFSALFTAGVVILIFVSFGLPVSSSQTLIGSVIGVGMARKQIHSLIVRKMILSWVVVLPAAFLFAAFLGWVL